MVADQVADLRSMLRERKSTATLAFDKFKDQSLDNLLSGDLRQKLNGLRLSFSNVKVDGEPLQAKHTAIEINGNDQLTV